MSTSRSMMDQADHILRDVFGFSAFRPGQRDIVMAVLSGKDVLGVLPTGGGKSLCYQVPALVFPRLTLVVSPLIALMKDQTERLRERGVQAFALHSGMSHGEVNDIIYRAARGEIKLLYVAPERLESSSFRAQLRAVPLSLLAIDEAHCISEWGHDFRPSYRSILTLFDQRERVPIIGLTATATPDVRADIISSLQMRKPVEIVRGFDRPNLSFHVHQTAAKVEFATKTVRDSPSDSVIVYCASRRRVELFVDELTKRGIVAAGYHGGMPHHQRAATQDAFLGGSASVLVATNAFGMGVDKPDVRHVVHADLTLSLEAYYQEAGRAGRDGRPATCSLLYQPEDKRLMNFYIETTYPDQQEIVDVYEHLCVRAGLALGSSTQTPILADSASIASALHATEAGVRGVLALMQRSGVIVQTSPHGSARITLRTSQERYLQFMHGAPPEYAAALSLISRYIHGRGLGEEIDLPVTEMLRRSDVTSAELSRGLNALHLASLIRYRPAHSGGGILLLGQRVSGSSLPIDYHSMQVRRNRALQKLDVVVGYAEARQCKRNFILSYFGDHSLTGVCGICSSCSLPPHRTQQISERTNENIRAIIQATWQLRGTFGRHVVVDVVRGVYSQKVREYRLDRSTAFGLLVHRSKSELLEAIDVALNAGLLVKSADLYPTLGVTAQGVDLCSPLPKQLSVQREALDVRADNSSGKDQAMKLLLAMRERIAQRNGVTEITICTNDELAALAEDMPSSVRDFVPGRHGSALFLTQYADDILACLQVVRHASQTQQVPKVDSDMMHLVAALDDTTTFDRLVRELQMTPAAVSTLLQRAIESGVVTYRGRLIDDKLYADVKDYMRYHRYAKLRDVRDHIGGEPALPELRVALAFARQDLYSEIEST